MSPWVLILTFHIGLGATSLTIDMPDEATCKRALEDARHQLNDVVSYYCLDRRSQSRS